MIKIIYENIRITEKECFFYTHDHSAILKEVKYCLIIKRKIVYSLNNWVKKSKKLQNKCQKKIYLVKSYKSRPRTL